MLAVAHFPITKMFDSNNTPLQTDITTDTIVKYALPVLTVLVLLITCLNLWLIFQYDISSRPSHLLYCNMLVLDLIIVVGGVCSEISILSGDSKITHFADTCYDVIYQMPFYTGILQLLGLGICRLFSLLSSATFFLDNRMHVAKVVAGFSWVFGGCVTVFRFTVLKTNTYMIVSNVVFFLLVSLTVITINLYILVKVIQVQAHLAQERFREVARLALLLFINGAVWNVFYDIRCISFLVIYFKSGNNFIDGCQDENWVYRMLFCGFIEDHLARHVICVTFLLDALGNNIILITQRENCNILKHVYYEIKRLVSLQLEDNNYEYAYEDELLI